MVEVWKLFGLYYKDLNFYFQKVKKMVTFCKRYKFITIHSLLDYKKYCISRYYLTRLGLLLNIWQTKKLWHFIAIIKYFISPIFLCKIVSFFYGTTSFVCSPYNVTLAKWFCAQLARSEPNNKRTEHNSSRIFHKIHITI